MIPIKIPTKYLFLRIVKRDFKAYHIANLGLLRNHKPEESSQPWGEGGGREEEEEESRR